MVFHELYQVWEKRDEEGNVVQDTGSSSLFYDESYTRKDQNEQLVQIEYIIDVIFCIEIVFNFVKRSNAYNDLKKISLNYI